MNMYLKRTQHGGVHALIALVIASSLQLGTGVLAQGVKGGEWVMRRYPPGARPPAVWALEERPTLAIGGPSGEGPAVFNDIVGIGALPGGAGAPLLFSATSELAVQGDRVCTGSSERYQISCYSGLGRSLFRIEREVGPREISEETRAFARQAYVDGNRSGSSPDELEKLRFEASQVRFADRTPAFGRLLIAADGHLWVSDFSPAERVIGFKAARVSRTP